MHRTNNGLTPHQLQIVNSRRVAIIKCEILVAPIIVDIECNELWLINNQESPPQKFLA